MDKDLDGLTGLDFQILSKRKMRRYIALHLSDLESESVFIDNVKMVPYEIARKLALDYTNDLVRSLWRIAGVEIEGTEYY